MNTLRWHRPLLGLAGLMAVMAVASLVGVVLDHRIVTGMNVWLKPLKFSLSITIYAVTLAWLIGQLGRFRRLAWVAGTIIAVAFLIEMVVVVGSAARGETSHFNESTPLHAFAFSLMGALIVVIWLMTLLVAGALFFTSLGDAARTVAVRAGAILALGGMAIAFFMVIPTEQQLLDNSGIVGAHTVGLADGGPGLPVFGWSTVAGDLRVPHFIGMHALQVLPLFVIALELLARGGSTLSRLLASPAVRVRLVLVATVTYTATLVTLTVQALSGQSVVAPAGPILMAGITIALLAGAAAVLVLVAGRKASQPTPGTTPPLGLRWATRP